MLDIFGKARVVRFLLSEKVPGYVVRIRTGNGIGTSVERLLSYKTVR